MALRYVLLTLEKNNGGIKDTSVMSSQSVGSTPVAAPTSSQPSRLVVPPPTIFVTICVNELEPSAEE